jgi:hypothetical protein
MHPFECTHARRHVGQRYGAGGAQQTAAIRADRYHGGEFGEGVRMDRYVPLHYTVAQKQDPRQFHAGQVLVFHQDTPDVRRHEAVEIVRVDPNQLVARTEAGEEHVVTGKQAQAFDVYERRPIELAPHDRILLTANRQESRLRVTNGEMVTVSHSTLFSMHDVVVTGCGLDALLADVAAQVVTVLQQPPRAEYFAVAPGPRVLALEVRRIEGSGP